MPATFRTPASEISEWAASECSSLLVLWGPSKKETGRSQWLWRGLPRRFAAPRGGAAAAERPPAARARWGSGRRPRGFPRAGQCQATDLACSGKIAGLARAASRSPAPAELGFLWRPGPAREGSFRDAVNFPHILGVVRCVEKYPNATPSNTARGVTEAAGHTPKLGKWTVGPYE